MKREIVVQILGFLKNPYILIMSLCVLNVLFLSQTSYRNYFSNQTYNSAKFIQYGGYIETWVKDGFWKFGGHFYNPSDSARTWHPDEYCYGTAPGYYLWIPFIAQKVYSSISGQLSRQILPIYCLILCFILSFLVGTLSFALCNKILPEITKTAAVCLAGSAMLVFQTFPQNLFMIFRPTAQTHFLIILSTIWLYLFHFNNQKETLCKKKYYVLFFLFLLLFLVEYVAACFLSFSLLLALLFSSRGSIKVWHLLKILILAFVTFLIYKNLLAMIAKFQNPKLAFLGSEFYFRSGLDGNIQFLSDHWALLWGRRLATSHPTVGPLEAYRFWPVYFCAGVASCLLIIFEVLRKPFSGFKFIFSTACIYVLYAFVFSNAVVIHADLYDPILIYAFTFSLFIFLPTLLYRQTKSLIIFPVTVIFAICYSMVSLRSFAIAFPIK